jgi:pyrroloquinoline quinone biosynthesis protein B
VEVVILGSAAGGGVPQWNCRCPVCDLAWAGDPRVRPRTQSSLAVSPDGTDWLLVNASPDIRQQIVHTPALRPRKRGRDSPISAVLVTNGDVDHVAGLLGLRERQSLTVYGTAQTLSVVSGNRIFGVLDSELVPRETIDLEVTFEPLPQLDVEVFAVPGKVPLWLEDERPVVGRETGETVGVALGSGGRRVVYIPGCAATTPSVLRRIEGADLLLFDGTLWRDEEMVEAGLGSKTGLRMGHMPMSGEKGSMAALAAATIGRRVFVHINNTNPTLVEGSPQRRGAEAAGWTIAHDGMSFSL